MRRVMVRYKVKSDRIAEHEKLIADVFAELSVNAPEKFRYRVFKQTDGASFVHLAIMDEKKNPLDGVAAFRAFTAGVKDRCEEPPVTLEYTDVAAYAM